MFACGTARAMYLGRRKMFDAVYGNDHVFVSILVFLRLAGVHSRKKCERADKSSRSSAICGNGWPKYLSFQMRR